MVQGSSAIASPQPAATGATEGVRLLPLPHPGAPRLESELAVPGRVAAGMALHRPPLLTRWRACVLPRLPDQRPQLRPGGSADLCGARPAQGNARPRLSAVGLLATIGTQAALDGCEERQEQRSVRVLWGRTRRSAERGGVAGWLAVGAVSGRSIGRTRSLNCTCTRAAAIAGGNGLRTSGSGGRRVLELVQALHLGPSNDAQKRSRTAQCHGSACGRCSSD